MSNANLAGFPLIFAAARKANPGKPDPFKWALGSLASALAIKLPRLAALMNGEQPTAREEAAARRYLRPSVPLPPMGATPSQAAEYVRRRGGL